MDARGGCRALTATDWKQPPSVVLPVAEDKGYERIAHAPYGNGRMDGRTGVFSEDSGVPALNATMGKEPYKVAVKVKEATRGGIAVAHEGDSVNLSVPGSKTRRGRVGAGVANTLDTSCNQGVVVRVSDNLTVYAIWYEKYQCYVTIRKLTPKECFRLQGWDDEYFERAAFVNSNSQLYKQAGNGVTVNVIKAIAERMKV